MNIIILYQNENELNRIKSYLKNFPKNFISENLTYFKSSVYINEKYNYDDNHIFNLKYYEKYKNIYINKLNNNQLNHLKSIKKILELSIEKNFDDIMILEYDIYFHKEFKKIYDQYKNLISNNDIIHLGSSQHKWYDIITEEKINVRESGNYKYYINSHSLGTFAVIIKKIIYMDYLNFINYVLTKFQYFPSDVILSILSRNYKSIVIYPNIIICNLNKSSIVKKNRENHYIKFKWYLKNYIIDK